MTDNVIAAIQSQLRGDESPAEIRALVQAAGLPESIAEELIQQPSASVAVPPPPPPPPDSVPLNSPAAEPTADIPATEFTTPRLLVDWGVPPEVGHQTRPSFMILCDPDTHSTPRIRLFIDEHLDFSGRDQAVSVAEIDDGQWEFHSAFGLTTDGVDCRPGQYLLRVQLSFQKCPDGVPRFFHSTIRLTVGQGGQTGPTLEIDGDGQSIVNLHGHDLRSFGRVVLKGSDAGIINLQSDGDSGESAPQADSVTFEYQLHVDAERQAIVPIVVQDRPRQHMDAASLLFADDRRVLLLTKKRVTLGRSRDADIVIRFLPRSAENDRLSRNISRSHAMLSLTENGLMVTDLSNSGTALEFDPIEDMRIVSLADGEDPLELELGITERLVLTPFLAELQLFGSRKGTSVKDVERDELYCETLGERVSRLWRLSHSTGIDSLRLKRCNNLAGQEEYVGVFRQALIGSSVDRCAISIPSPGIPPVAARLVWIGRTFWLESLSDDDVISVDGVPALRRHLVPLSIGARLSFGSTNCTFGSFQQLEL